LRFLALNLCTFRRSLSLIGLYRGVDSTFHVVRRATYREYREILIPSALESHLTPHKMALRAPVFKRATSSIQSQVRFYSAPGEGAIPLSKQKYVPSSGTYPRGFQASSQFVGVKASNKNFDDLALVASDKPCSGAAVFTKNKFQAAPVTVSRETLQRRGGS